MRQRAERAGRRWLRRSQGVWGGRRPAAGAKGRAHGQPEARSSARSRLS